MSAHSLRGSSCRKKIHTQNKRWSISALQPYRPPAQNRARPGRAGGFLSPFTRGRRVIIALLQTPENLLLKGLSNRALKQIAFKMLTPEQSGRSNSPCSAGLPAHACGACVACCAAWHFAGSSLPMLKCSEALPLMLCRQMFFWAISL